MRWLVWIALVACQQNKRDHRDVPVPHPPVPGPPAPISPAPTDAVTGGPAIDLFASLPTTIVVSSRVANRKILPRHLVDRDLETAWNSATGELAGAWLDIAIPGATITELRMTVGHTGHGPRGEDYFTMNPRIRTVTVTSAGMPPRTFTLDPANRALQPLAIHATGSLHLVVGDVVMGSNPSWRETAISELQAWGTPPAGWKAPPTPLVPYVTVAPAPTADELDPCFGADAAREAFIKQHAHDEYSGPGGEDHSYPPTCEPLALPDDLPPLWAHAGAGCPIDDEIYGPKTCIVSFAIGASRAKLELPAGTHGDVDISSITEVPALRGVAVRFKTGSGDWLGVCRSAPLGCSTPIRISGDHWGTVARIGATAIVLEADQGSAPADVLGSHSLDFH